MAMRYTVVLLYPEREYGGAPDTYTTYVDALSVLDALDKARMNCVQENMQGVNVEQARDWMESLEPVYVGEGERPNLL